MSPPGRGRATPGEHAALILVTQLGRLLSYLLLLVLFKCKLVNFLSLQLDLLWLPEDYIFYFFVIISAHSTLSPSPPLPSQPM